MFFIDLNSWLLLSTVWFKREINERGITHLKIKYSTIKDFFLVFLSAILTIILFDQTNGVENQNYIIAIIDAFFKSLTMVIVISTINDVSRKTYISGVAVFLLVAVLYNQNSVTKYAVESLYDGAISNSLYRFLGSCFINILLIFGVLIWKHIHLSTRVFKIDSNKFITELHVNSYIVYTVLITYVLLQIYSLISTGRAFTSTDSRTLRTFYTTFEYICFTILVYNVKKTGNKIELKSLIPIVLILLFLAFFSITTGSKQSLIRSALVIACGLIFLKKLEFTQIKTILYVSPLIMQIFTSLTEVISGRFSYYDSYWTLRYHLFRYDLSDLAITIASRFGQATHQKDMIFEALQNSVPSFIFENKSEVLNMYYSNIKSIGLEGFPMDYNDTIFSFGAQIGGYVGIVVTFFLIIFLFEWISTKVVQIRAIGPAILIVFFSYFSYVESDLYMFIYNTRDLIIYFIISWLIFKFTIYKNINQRARL